MRVPRWLLSLAWLLLSLRAEAFPSYKTHPDDFFYSQQTSLWIFFKAPRQVLRASLGATLDALGLELASFEDPTAGYLILKPMVFSAEFGHQRAAIPGTSTSTEVELTALVEPKTRPSRRGTFSQFLQGGAGEVGQLRLDVLCDHEVAVAAGRKNFGEHKYLASFEYDYPTANGLVGASKPFALDLTAYTSGGAGREKSKLFRVRLDLAGIGKRAVPFAPELLYSAFPPEPVVGVRQQTVGEHRHYNGALWAFGPKQVRLETGEGLGAVPLKPVAPFGDGRAIPGSEAWPGEFRDRLRDLIPRSTVAGFLLFQSASAEFETKPFPVVP